MIYKYIHTTSNFSISTNDIYNKKLRILVSKSITDLFSGFLKSNAKTTEINFKFTDRIDSFINMNDYTRLNNIKTSDNQVYYKDHEIEFITKKDSYEVIINIIDNESLISHLKIFNKAFKNNIELQVSTFYYRIFLFFTQLWNIKNNFSYLHSSAIQVNDKGILFTSSSGTGKSSLLLKVFNHNVNFIADDLTIISDKSMCYYQGRAISIKPYHIKYFNSLKLYIKKFMPFFQKLQWNIVNDNRLSFRISPLVLFKKYKELSKINTIYHLCNHSKNTFEIKDISSEELVRLSLPILTSEFFLFNKNLNNLASLPNSNFITSYELYKKTESIYKKAFYNKKIKLIFIPFRSDPNKLFSFLNKMKCFD